MLYIYGKKTFRAYDASVESISLRESLPTLKPEFTAKTLQEAVKKAEQYTLENLVEYGYSFVDL